jgi:hypothetical protein
VNGLMDGLSICDKKTGNGKPWLELLQRHLSEKGTGTNPTDRAKSGTVRSMVVDGKGVRLAITLMLLIDTI